MNHCDHCRRLPADHTPDQGCLAAGTYGHTYTDEAP